MWWRKEGGGYGWMNDVRVCGGSGSGVNLIACRRRHRGSGVAIRWGSSTVGTLLPFVFFVLFGDQRIANAVGDFFRAFELYDKI
jgi:hypothetical protein